MFYKNLLKETLLKILDFERKKCCCLVILNEQLFTKIEYTKTRSRLTVMT